MEKLMRPLVDLVVNEEGAVAVLEGGVSVEHRVVRFHQGSWHLSRGGGRDDGRVVTSPMVIDLVDRFQRRKGGYSCWSHLRCWVDGETQLGFLPIVDRKTLQKQRCKPRPSASSEGMENQETLQLFNIVNF